MEDYKIELLAPGDFDKLIPLMRNSFGVNVSVGYFKWKFLENPAGPFVGFVALTPSGECAAYYGVIPEVYRFGETERTIFQSCDTMTHSDHRRKGLFQLLATTCYAHLKERNQLFVIGFGGGQSTPGFIKFGWKKVLEVGYLFRPRMLSLLSRPFRKSASLRVSSEKDYASIVAFHSGNAGTIRQAITKEFITWRFLNPLRSYEIRMVQNANGERKGYFSFYEDDGKIILFDYITLIDDARVTMINFLDDLCMEKKLRGIVTIGQPGTSFYTTLNRHGFWGNSWNLGPLHEKIPFIYYADEREINSYLKSSDWKIIPLNHDFL